MKQGDVVTVRDGSYSWSIINGKSIHEIGVWLPDEKFTVIEAGCKFPVIDPWQNRYEPVLRFNNTVIQAIDSGKVVFIEERFLKLVPPKHKVMLVEKMVRNHAVAGTFVEISDKLYQEIKRETK